VINICRRTTDLVIALAFHLRMVVLGFLGQLNATSSSGDPLRVTDSTPPVLPFKIFAWVVRSLELETDNVHAMKSRRNFTQQTHTIHPIGP